MVTELATTKANYCECGQDLWESLQGLGFESGKKSISFEGPPGVGKTTFAALLGHQLAVPVFCVDTAYASMMAREMPRYSECYGSLPSGISLRAEFQVSLRDVADLNVVFDGWVFHADIMIGVDRDFEELVESVKARNALLDSSDQDGFQIAEIEKYFSNHDGRSFDKEDDIVIQFDPREIWEG